MCLGEHTFADADSQSGAWTQKSAFSNHIGNSEIVVIEAATIDIYEGCWSAKTIVYSSIL